MPLYAVVFRPAPDEREPLQRCSIDAVICILLSALLGFPGGSDSQESPCNAGDSDSISGSGRSPGEGKGYPRQYSSWRIPWTEEPDGLQSVGLQRVGHD